MKVKSVNRTTEKLDLSRPRFQPSVLRTIMQALVIPSDESLGYYQPSVSRTIAQVYGFTDLDGTSPDIWQHMEEAEKS